VSGPAGRRLRGRLRRRGGHLGDTWYLDELFVTIQGRPQYLWRAVDEDGDVIDILVQSRRDRHAATHFFRKLLKRQGSVPRRLVTGKLRSHAAARRAVMPSVVHLTDQYANNRADVSHQPTRQRERQMRRFSRPPRCNASRPCTASSRISSGGPTSAPVGSPPVAAEGSVPGVGGGDVRLLNECRRSAFGGTTRGPRQLDSAFS